MTVFTNPICPDCTDEFPRTWTFSKNQRCKNCSAQLFRTRNYNRIFAIGLLSGYLAGLLISKYLNIESFLLHMLVVLSAVFLSVDLAFRFASTLSIRLFATKQHNRCSTAEQK